MSKTKPDDNKEKALFDAGVKEYSAAGRYYYDIGYKPPETHVLAAFRITPQEGVSFEEAAAAVAAAEQQLLLGVQLQKTVTKFSASSAMPWSSTTRPARTSRRAATRSGGGT